MTIQNAAGDSSGWRVEPLVRYGCEILIIYKDGETRGQIEILDKTEKNKWLDLIQNLNSE